MMYLFHRPFGYLLVRKILSLFYENATATKYPAICLTYGTVTVKKDVTLSRGYKIVTNE